MTEGLKPLGVVLAGGAATRLGGSKAKAELAGRPLIAYPLAAFADAGIEPVIVAKASTELPPVTVAVVTEPEEPVHPLLGLVTGLRHAGGRPIVTAPCDTPFVTGALLEALAAAESTVVVHDGERLHPLLARYRPEDLAVLEDRLAQRGSVTAAAESLSPGRVQASPAETFNVNTPGDLLRATTMAG